MNVATTGTYTVTFEVASPDGVTDGLHLPNTAGTNLTGSIKVPEIGGWQTWTTVTASVTLPAGQQVLTWNQDKRRLQPLLVRICLVERAARFGEFFRRMRAKLGTAQAITATAHKIARILYHVLSTKEPHTETVFHRCDEQAHQRAEMRLRKQAARLGFQLLPIPPTGE